MLAIAAVTAGSSGRSPRTRPGGGSRCPRTPSRSRPSPRGTGSGPVTPAARAVVIAWASNRPQPVAEAVLPLRSRARAITGAASGVRDRGELDVQPADPGVAERGGLLGVAVDLADGVVDIEERDPLARRHRRAGRAPARHSPASSPPPTLSSCWTWPWVNERRNVPSVEGARTPANNRPIPPWRSRSRSSMRVRAGEHPADHRGRLRRGVGRGDRQRRSRRS